MNRALWLVIVILCIGWYRQSRLVDLLRCESMIVKTTVYTLHKSECGKNKNHPQYGTTYSGRKAKVGTVAIDRKVIDLYSEIYIPNGVITSSGTCYDFIAEDTGSKVKGKHCDIFYGGEEYHKKAGLYGCKSKLIYIGYKRNWLDKILDKFLGNLK